MFDSKNFMFNSKKMFGKQGLLNHLMQPHGRLQEIFINRYFEMSLRYSWKKEVFKKKIVRFFDLMKSFDDYYNIKANLVSEYHSGMIFTNYFINISFFSY